MRRSNALPPFTDDVEDIDWAVSIKDISKGGLKLLVERRFESGTVLHINTATVSIDAPKALIAKVLHVVRDKTGRWSLGCQFAKELSSQEMVELRRRSRLTKQPHPCATRRAGSVSSFSDRRNRTTDLILHKGEAEERVRNFA